MDLDSQRRNALIAFAALGGTGLLLAFGRTWKWFSRSGRTIIDIVVR